MRVMEVGLSAERTLQKWIVQLLMRLDMWLRTWWRQGLRRRPVSIFVDSFGTGKVSDERLAQIVEENFDLRPAAIIRDLDLRRPIYRQVAAYGHFGRTDIDVPWEKTDRADKVRMAAEI